MTFDPPRNRPAKARIRIGLSYIAAEPFDGHIVSELTASEVAYKTNQLKFTVKEKSQA